MDIYNLFISFLKEELSVSWRDVDESSLNFSYNNLNYMFVYNKNADNHYFRLLLPKIDQGNPNYPLLSELNYSVKPAKGFVVDNNYTWISCEQFVFSEISINLLFRRMMSSLDYYLSLYRQKANV